MRDLSPAARAYLIACYLLGALAFGWLVASYHGPLVVEDWLLAAGLTAVAAACQVFVVMRAHSDRADHLTQAPLFAAVLLLPRPLLALAVVLLFLPEWYIHKRKWFIQCFNIASYLITCTVTRLTLFALTGHFRLDAVQRLPWLSLLAAAGAFLGAQTLVLAWTLKLARTTSFRESGLFAPDKLFVEVALLAMGVGFATSWLSGPVYGLIASVPLALIFQALHVPNLKEEAATDPKTGLANMRHFNTVMARDLERAERNGQAVSLLVGDLDYLRNINNTYGHQAGDIVLCGIADIIKRTIRAGDVAARFGGEEFVILLADTDSERAIIVAERLRNELEDCRFAFRDHDPICATISIGVATFPVDGRTAESLMHEADLAVYQAKREGRNRVVVAGRQSRELAGEWAKEHLVPAPVVALSAPVETRPRWNFVTEVTRAAVTGNRRSPRPSSAAQANEARPSSGQHRRRRKPDPSPRLLGMIGLIVLAGLVGLLHALPVAAVPWGPLALFGGLSILAEQLAVFTSGRGKTSVAVVAVLGATFLYDGLGILTAALALAISAAIRARSPIHRLLFNFGAAVLSAEAANLFFEQFIHGPLRDQALAYMIVPAIGAGIVYYAVNHALLCVVRGMDEQCSPVQIWQAEYRWLLPHYAVMGALALVTALGYLYLGTIGLMALMAPVAMMHVAIKQYIDHTTVYVDELERMNRRLKDSYEATLQALSRALDTRDEETEEHSQRVKRYTELMARRLEVPDGELQDIVRGALLHDVGKIGVPDAILLKPGKLTDEERDQMRKHPEIGYSMIAHIPFLARPAQVVLHHHEAYDGSGYPSNLSGGNIPLGARIFAVADTFDAMTSDRPYRRALPPEAAFAELRRCSGMQFDPLIVEAFLSIPLPELMAARDGVVLPSLQRDVEVGTHPATPEPMLALQATS